MSQNATRNAKGNSAKTASNTKQTQNSEDTTSANKTTLLPKDPNRIAESLKPTPEQIRLASILAVKNENLESNQKVKQIIEVCPDVSEDTALMVLHENDYDVNRVIEYLMEGGEVSQNWKTAGTKPVKPKPSPNQVLDENQADTPKSPPKRDERRNRDRKSKPIDKKLKKINVETPENEAKLEERIENLDLNENDENMPKNINGRGGGRGRFGGRGRGGGRGAFRGRAPRNDRREPRRTHNEFINSSLKNNADDEVEESDRVLVKNDHRVANLREIGTWSNEQAGKTKRANFQADELENDEEWQGDLSKTQIFTASTQKKEFSETIQQNDFPIGHFNAEEATQNIKKAIGLGSEASPPAPVASTTPPVPEQNETKTKQNQIRIPPSAKPLPPPNTKIPKSAVIMPDGSTSSSISFNLDLQFGVDLDDQLVSKTKNVSSQQTQLPLSKNLNQISYSKAVDTASNVQKPQAQKQSSAKQFTSQAQNQPQSQTIPPAQPQRPQYQNKETPNQLLNISPSNKLPNSSSSQQQPQQVLNQLQQIQTTHQSSSATVTTNKVTPNSNPNPPTTPGGTVAPPPGVNLLNPNNLVNPNNPYLIGLPFNQNFPYFDQTQIDTNLLQMYNHLANMPPPGVGAPSGQSGPQYPMSDSKFPRNEVTPNTNTPLNSSNPSNGQLNQPQQQQPPINLIPNLNNYPFFFPNYPYPNLFMQIPNGGQTTPGASNQPPPPPFANKPPYNHNFSNNQEDYSNYPAQANSQMKNSSSNLSNVNDISNQPYSKTEKSQSGYHAPTPPNQFSNQLLSQQNPAQHANLGNSQSAPQSMTYIASMMGSHGGNMVHPGIQDNLNRNPASGNLKTKYNWNQ